MQQLPENNNNVKMPNVVSKLLGALMNEARGSAMAIYKSIKSAYEINSQDISDQTIAEFMRMKYNVTSNKALLEKLQRQD